MMSRVQACRQGTSLALLPRLVICLDIAQLRGCCTARSKEGPKTKVGTETDSEKGEESESRTSVSAVVVVGVALRCEPVPLVAAPN